ncbi:hypothetical protein BDR07DRAFT_1382928 [Suillus spraguei]|nr:hypothetical protein BDR07DRAFT_1382928 [Suillus spraguei]
MNVYRVSMVTRYKKTEMEELQYVHFSTTRPFQNYHLCEIEGGEGNTSKVQGISCVILEAWHQLVYCVSYQNPIQTSHLNLPTSHILTPLRIPASIPFSNSPVSAILTILRSQLVDYPFRFQVESMEERLPDETMNNDSIPKFPFFLRRKRLWALDHIPLPDLQTYILLLK